MSERSWKTIKWLVKTVHNYSLLAFSETYFVRKLQPDINDGLKACADFRVFDF